MFDLWPFSDLRICRNESFFAPHQRSPQLLMLMMLCCTKSKCNLSVIDVISQWKCLTKCPSRQHVHVINNTQHLAFTVTVYEIRNYCGYHLSFQTWVQQKYHLNILSRKNYVIFCASVAWNQSRKPFLILVSIMVWFNCNYIPYVYDITKILTLTWFI